jgi:hypothetical protein
MVLHLVRRSAPDRIAFAALRWIPPRHRPRRRWRVERPWLLLARLALLGVLALLLARPAWIDPAAPSAARAFVAPGVERAAVGAALAGRTLDLRWLAPGFPAFDQPDPGPVPFASLLREADAQLPAEAPLVVLVPRELAGLDGERLHLAHAVEWRVLPGAMPAAPAPTGTRVRVAVRYAPAAREASSILRAAVAAWNAQGPDTFVADIAPLDEPLAPDTRWLAWLAPEVPASVERWIGAGGHALLVQQPAGDGDPLWRDAEGAVLARTAVQGRGRVVALAGALSPASLPRLLDAGFPRELREALAGAPPAPTLADATAAAPPTEPAPGATSEAASQPPRPLDPRLVLLVAALFLLERALAGRATPRA